MNGYKQILESFCIITNKMWTRSSTMLFEKRVACGKFITQFYGMHGDALTNLSDAFKESKTKFFVISFTSDWLYPTTENREIVIALNAIGADVGFIEITSDKGHDSFLLDVPDFLSAVKNFLNNSYKNIYETRI